MLIRAAYGINDYQLPGGPGWIDSERYDIVAKAPPNTPNNRLGPMLQKLLADRFKLAVYHETRELPVYALIVGKDGPKIHEVDREPKEGDGDSRKGRGRITAQRVHISELAELLSTELGISVIDRTSLKGFYDLKLEWMPDATQPRGPGDGIEARVSSPPGEKAGPSVFAAVQEQLGLRLISAKGPVETLAIDHVEKPSEN